MGVGVLRAGETRGVVGGGGRGGSVQESWRVVVYLHAQSLFTLHQAAGTATEDTASGWHSVSTFTC